jgi:hypothetical protein
VLPLEAEGRSVGTGGPDGARAPAAADAQPDRPHLEQRIIAFALGHPELGPRRISAELARDKWGGIRITEHGIWRVGLNTRSKRLALIARHRDPYAQARSATARAAHRRLGARRDNPARLLLRRAAFGDQGHGLAVHRHRRRQRVLQGRAAHLTAQPPLASHPRTAAPSRPRARRRRVELQEVTTDSGSEFRAKDCGAEVERPGARQRFIRAGRPNSNGCVERAQLTILEEC